MDGCAQMCKWFLILFNSLFALVGFGLVLIGFWLRFGAQTQGLFDIDLNTADFTIGVTVLMVTGVLMLVTAVIGDCGVCNQSKTSLSVFAGLLSVLMMAEIAAGVMSFMWGGQVADFYLTVYAQYVNSRSVGQAVALKLFHNAFDCCGVGGGIELFVRDTCPDGNFVQKLTFSSCPNVIISMFDSKAPLLLGGFLGTAAVMMVALVCCCVLSNRLKASLYSSPSVY
ncbi:CD9 antigen isoform X2 [Xyrauchen texanus]|uniref:CD9 antigen isoform X2 n=1 Tax=Xyrauchen texanus TaxID=154827 RepID=UPI0022423151|nr:CD9 antigen isoform X2 [Xyrauchen texanus]